MELLPIETFELRRNKLLVENLKDSEINDYTVAKLYYLFTDYWLPKNISSVKNELLEIKKSITSLEEKIAKQNRDYQQKKKEYETKISHLSKEDIYFLRYVEYITQGRDTRKDPLAKIQYLIYLSLSEFAKRFGLGDEEIPYLTIDEVTQDKKLFKKEEIQKRVNACYAFGNYNGDIVIGTEEYDFFVEEVKRQVKKFRVDENINELYGNVAFRGVVRGVIKVVIDPHNYSSFNQGDILVASMTRPEFVPLMKKAGAVITNEGGITCHAAIVARELQIPTIIGTKNATQILKDGDLVEVDADNGVVKILKRAGEGKKKEEEN